eukprot:c8342_g1_i1.p1 GENE.c8342_g1_i1~~c8342_g1_i1.p1  ORF type:complete len:563 (+),score=165.38 c8342_g1_i1:44-1690(+)
MSMSTKQYACKWVKAGIAQDLQRFIEQDVMRYISRLLKVIQVSGKEAQLNEFATYVREHVNKYERSQGRDSQFNVIIGSRFACAVACPPSSFATFEAISFRFREGSAQPIDHQRVFICQLFQSTTPTALKDMVLDEEEESVRTLLESAHLYDSKTQEFLHLLIKTKREAKKKKGDAQTLKKKRSNITEKQTESLRISGDALLEYRDIFADIDRDGSGSLDVHELSSSLGIPFEKCLELMAKGDLNNDNTLDFDEFVELFSSDHDLSDLMKKESEVLIDQLELISKRIGVKMVESYRQLFQQIDRNGDGFISIRELAATLELPFDRCFEIVWKGDKNGDNLLDLCEFIEVMESQEEEASRSIDPPIEKPTSTATTSTSRGPSASVTQKTVTTARNGSAKDVSTARETKAVNSGGSGVSGRVSVSSTSPASRTLAHAKSDSQPHSRTSSANPLYERANSGGPSSGRTSGRAGTTRTGTVNTSRTAATTTTARQGQGVAEGGDVESNIPKPTVVRRNSEIGEFGEFGRTNSSIGTSRGLPPPTKVVRSSGF